MNVFGGVVISLVLCGVWFAGFWYFLVLVAAVFCDVVVAWCDVCDCGCRYSGVLRVFAIAVA